MVFSLLKAVFYLTNLFRGQREYPIFKNYIFAGRFYLSTLFGNIYEATNENELSIKENILKNLSFFGDPCDPYEQYNNNQVFPEGNEEFEENISEYRKCHNKLHNSVFKTDVSILREGWRIATCNQLNQNFSDQQKPLRLISEVFENLNINEDSIKYAYHLFNPFLELPNEVVSNLSFFF